MKKHEIEVGGEYTARVSGRFVTIRVMKIEETFRFGRDVTQYHVKNLATGRDLTFASAAKFRGKARNFYLDMATAIVGVAK